jgi:hypothetical protein
MSAVSCHVMPTSCDLESTLSHIISPCSLQPLPLQFSIATIKIAAKNKAVLSIATGAPLHGFSHQKQHHVPYSLAISINGTFLLIHGIASTLWAFQYVFLIIYFRYFLFLVIFSCPIETVPYLRNFSFQKFGFPSIFIFLYFHLI